MSLRCVCWICYRFAAPSLKAVVRHMATVHAHDPRFHICCGIEGCSRAYTNFYSFKKHLYRKHRACLDVSGPFDQNSSQQDNGDNEINFYDYLDNENDNELDGRLSHFQCKKQMALFLLKSREIRKVSQVALDGLIADFTSILQLTVHQLQLDIDAVLKDNGVRISTFNGLADVFCNPKRIEPFKDLSSKFVQEKFYREYRVSFYV